MYKLATQFESKSRQVTAAAAGGSTTTSCCSCIVTIATASVLTSMHFASMVPVEEKRLQEAGSTFYEPTTIERSALGFIALPSALLAGAVTFGIGLLVVWLWAFVAVYKKAGHRNAIGVALLSLLVIVPLAVFEMIAWMN